jgi:hypothetical protein
MLPNIESHGHHSASGLLALETIERLHQNQSKDIKIPTVIGGSEFTVNELQTYTSNRLAEISSITPNQFRFNRTWKLSNTSHIPTYQMIVIWTCSEHKSQGGLIAETLSLYARENEQYFYFSINHHQNEQMRIALIQNLFNQLVDIHQYNTGNVL